ncbi:MAG: 4'-phosphopantetheinyl transferase superfamily protein [Verrucomicrobiales bacterium]|nr:4'-phosphopantetheinyl transferase superfamily protein [Verrucomicrobiales bacterium]
MGPAAHVVTCWAIPLEVPSAVLEAAGTFLDGGELARAGRYAFEHHRRRFLARRLARRMILGRALSIEPGAVGFLEVGAGKPEVVALDGRVAHFSASHSEDFAVVAVSERMPIGVDVEAYRMVEGSLWEVRHLFAESERLALERVSERERSRLFFDCWTRKEACVKADGAGLSVDLDSYEVPVGPLTEPVEVTFAGATASDSGVLLLPLNLGNEVSGALAVAGKDGAVVEVRSWDWGEALRG